jgi:hypothetical protein
MKTDLLIAKVYSAKHALVSAESDLEAALHEIQNAPRADKIAISEVLDGAFVRLRKAKADLAEIQAIIVEDET